MKSHLFPFAAIVGQDEMKKALIYNAIDPSIGGVLIRGEKGTGKSTAVRAIAAVLPPREVVKGCRYHCHPSQPEGLCPDCAEKARSGAALDLTVEPTAVVDLPLNASEDRVVGSIDVEAAIKSGEKRFEPGILANAHRSILYVDEVNLLDDHIVDILLDVAVTGRNVVEREGITCAHPSRFILVGTMNPEEGDLRPQLLDRFGLCVDIQAELDLDNRKEIVKRTLAFQAGHDSFLARWERQQVALSERIRRAKELLPAVTTPEPVLDYVVELAVEMNVDGHRADITLVKSARAAAAFNGRQEVTAEDIKESSALALRHRIRGKSLHQIKLGFQKLEDLLHNAVLAEQPRGRESGERRTGDRAKQEDGDAPR